MTLVEWLDKQGAGAKAELTRRTGFNWPTIDRACKGRATDETAAVIRAATRNRVSKESMTCNNRQRVAALAKLKRIAS